MALYLVVHSPVDPDDVTVFPPSRLLDMATDLGATGSAPRWLKAWSPDVNDDRIFTLWEAEDAAEIGSALDQYGFLSHMAARPLRVSEWGPDDVVTAQGAV